MWDFTPHNNTLNEGWCETAKLNVMAARMLHGVCLFWGGSRSTKPCVFACKVAAAGDETCLLCGGCGMDCFEVNRFLLCVLQRVLVHVCVVLCVSWICDCRSYWNCCTIVVISCCHVRRYMRVSHVMLQNALWWLHECCMALVGRKPEHETLCFSV